jgi:Domain of unknown function (DUF4123)
MTASGYRTTLASESGATAQAPIDLLDALRPSGTFQLFALLDPARDPEVLKMLSAARVNREPLYASVKGTDFRAVAPQLVSVSDNPGLLRTFLSIGWGRAWGILLLSSHVLPDLRQHLRRLLTARLHDGRLVYFRFYDPRIMRVFLPTCTADEARAVFGPVCEYLVESDGGASIHRFVLTTDGLVCRELPVTASRPPADVPQCPTPTPANHD